MFRVKNISPSLNWIREKNYFSDDLRSDILAGLTLGVLLIPQGMAYALIIGVPPIFGLYASLSPALLYVIFGTSRTLSVGPTALGALITASAVIPLAQGDEMRLISLTITLTLIAGIVRALLGLLRMGFLANFLSKPILSGFTSAAALIIASSQLRHFLGLNTPGEANILEVWIYDLTHLSEVHLPTVSMGIGGIMILILVMKFGKIGSFKIPGSLIVVILGISISALLQLNTKGLNIVGEIPAGLPGFSIPQLHIADIKLLLPGAFTLAILGFIESISIAKWSEQNTRDHRVSANRELVAIGFANVFGAFFQSFPVTGSFSRTAINFQMGSKSQVSALVASAFILLTLLFLTPLFYHLPKAILASIIIFAVVRLVDIKLPLVLWKKGRKDFYTLIITFFITLAIGIEAGVLVGVTLALLMVVYEMAQPHYAVMGHLPNTRSYRNINRFSDIEQRPDMLILRFDGRLFFGNAENFQEVIVQNIRKKGPDLKVIIIAAKGMHAIDYTGIEALTEVIDQCKQQNIKVFMSGVLGPVRDVFARYHLFEKIGEDAFFLNVHEAVTTFDERQAGKQIPAKPAARQHH